VSIIAIVLLVLAALLVFLFVGGLIATARRRRTEEAQLRAELEAANEALARAHAEDKGWRREVMEEAAGAAWAARHPGEPIDALHLVAVIDRPGTDEDEAVFRVISHGRQETLRLGRRDGEWVSAAA
jgi:hypothetical protein